MFWGVFGKVPILLEEAIFHWAMILGGRVNQMSPDFFDVLESKLPLSPCIRGWSPFVARVPY